MYIAYRSEPRGKFGVQNEKQMTNQSGIVSVRQTKHEMRGRDPGYDVPSVLNMCSKCPSTVQRAGVGLERCLVLSGRQNVEKAGLSNMQEVVK